MIHKPAKEIRAPNSNDADFFRKQYAECNVAIGIEVRDIQQHAIDIAQFDDCGRNVCELACDRALVITLINSSARRCEALAENLKDSDLFRAL